MHPWGQNYTPSQLLAMTKVDGLEHNPDVVKNYTSKVLALVTTEKDPDELLNKIDCLFYEVANIVSIGKALDHLVGLAKSGETLGLDYGRDGLDCLTYHLSSSMCRDAIDALRLVLKRFESDKNKAEEAPKNFTN